MAEKAIMTGLVTFQRWSSNVLCISRLGRCIVDSDNVDTLYINHTYRNILEGSCSSRS